MIEEHKGLPVHGYQPQSDAKVALVNGFKQDEERLLRKLDGLQQEKIKTGKMLGDGFPEKVLIADQRWLAIARTGFEQAFMALNRAVFQPQRIKLPEDDGNPPGRQTSPEVAALAAHYLRLDDNFLKLSTLDAEKVMTDIRKLAASALGSVQE